MKEKNIIDLALDALNRLLKMFSIERYIYLGLTVFSFFLLIFAIYHLITTEPVETATLVAIFGSGGLIAVSAGRVIFIFNKAFSVIEELIRNLSK